jgi:dTDP-4-dehydrorhamnose 3,5-epimerase
MKFTETKLKGAYIVEIKRIEDNRGFFARSWCREEFETAGLKANLAQINVAYTREQGTIRGMHFQKSPFAEAKLVSCTRGEVYDVMIDLRPDSATRGAWVGVVLSAENARMLYIPEGFAHGYQTLSDDAGLSYLTTAFYTPSAVSGVRYDDPAFGIEWPLPVSVISEADKKWSDYRG